VSEPTSRRRLSAVARVALAASLMLAVGVIALVGLAYGIVVNRLSSDLDATLLREADAYAAAVGSLETTSDAPSLDLVDTSRTYLTARGKRPSAFAPILIVKLTDGRVISNSDVALETAPGNAAALDPAKARRAFADVAYHDETFRTATVPIQDAGGATLGVFQAALPLGTVQQIAQQVGSTMLLTGLAIVLAGAAISAFVARGALAPLHDVASTAEAVGRGSLSRRVDYLGPNDDVGRMVGAFNVMLDRLEAAFGQQRRFVADASHELRTPLTIVRGHLDVLTASAGEELTEEQRDTLDLVTDELERMSRLVEDLLALARLEAGSRHEYQQLDLCTIATEAIDKSRTLGERRFELATTKGAWVRGDHDQLLQALLNLLSNAVSHTRPGGLVSLSCRTLPGAVEVDIADDGPGIRRDDLPRVFDRFYRSQGPRPADTGGSGLGLAITKRLVELHGGSVRVANRAAGGAVFTIRLPALPARAAVPPARPPGASPG
jgi:two-component system OmpR family sensor kinase